MASPHATLSCKDDGWAFELLRHLKESHEVDLRDFDLAVHGRFCQGLAREYDMVAYYDPNYDTMRFFKPVA
jgi:hypothetical protein